MPRQSSRSAARPMIRASRTDGFEIITAPTVHPLARLLGLLIRLRAEITTALAVIAVWVLLTSWLRTPFVIALVAVAIAVVLVTPVLRRFVAYRAAAVMTRHRLRQVLVERRCLNFSRHAPLFLWSHPTEVGDTVWLFLRAGISPTDVEEQADWIASGCFARDARVSTVRSMTALVKVEVIRRDPLARELIDSELADWTTTTGQRPPWGTKIVPPRPGNAHWSGIGDRGGRDDSKPVQRPTLDERDDVPPVVIEHPAPTAPPTPRPEPVPEPVAVPDRRGDWSDYV